MTSQEKAAKTVAPQSVTGTGKIEDTRGKKFTIELKADLKNDKASH